MDKIKIQEVVKYLVQWKEFMEKHDIWKKKENLENVKKDNSWIWEENKCRSKIVEKVRYS